MTYAPRVNQWRSDTSGSVARSNVLPAQGGGREVARGNLARELGRGGPGESFFFLGVEGEEIRMIGSRDGRRRLLELPLASWTMWTLGGAGKDSTATASRGWLLRELEHNRRAYCALRRSGLVQVRCSPAAACVYVDVCEPLKRVHFRTLRGLIVGLTLRSLCVVQ